jgi:DNA-binding response OmpR family regulator
MDQSIEPTRQTPSECANLTPEDTSELEQLAENSAQILIVSARPQIRDRIGEILAESDCSVRAVVGADQARSLMLEGFVDLVLIDRAIGENEAFELCATCSGSEPGVVTILLVDNPSFDDAIQAMRCGAVDLLRSDISSAQLFEHVNSGLDRARHLRKRERRALRLRGLCLRLNAARQEVSQHVGELCSDLVEAYQDLSGQIEHIGIASELNSLLRQELDLECLLRTTLEYLLSKIGSTNAAIFLPSSTGEFSLGAYVNYDRAKDEAEVMLDHLAAVLAPRFEKRTDSVWLRDAKQVEDCLEDESHWLEDSQTLIVPCHDSGECLAVLVAFRDRNAPFVEEDLRTIEVLGDLFGRQLARVINIHHRHMPKDEWGLDEGDLAA